MWNKMQSGTAENNAKHVGLLPALLKSYLFIFFQVSPFANHTLWAGPCHPHTFLSGYVRDRSTCLPAGDIVTTNLSLSWPSAGRERGPGPQQSGASKPPFNHITGGLPSLPGPPSLPLLNHHRLLLTGFFSQDFDLHSHRFFSQDFDLPSRSFWNFPLVSQIHLLFLMQ